jgi:hypothetical protein
MLDYIVMASGWLACLCAAVWLYSKKKITPAQIIEFLDLLWDSPHVKEHFEKSFEDLSKKFADSCFGALLKDWWNMDEENGDVDAAADETEKDNKEAKKIKVKKAKKTEKKDEEE